MRRRGTMNGMQLCRFQCGCEADCHMGRMIRYCPLHAAAREMRKLLEEACDELYSDTELYSKILDVLKKTKGGECATE